MSKPEIEEVLENWIGQALSPSGQLVEGVSAATWVTQNFLRWWRGRVDESLGDAEYAIQQIREELNRAGSWEKLGEAMNELCRAQDAIADLRIIFGSSAEPDAKA